MKKSKSNKPAWSELFFDLALIGAFLSFGVDFGKDPTLESGIVLVLKLVVIFWAWQQTALFVNRLGDPFSRELDGRLLVSLLRWAFFALLISIIALSLIEGGGLNVSDINSEIGLSSAAIVLSVAATYELGGRIWPEFRELAVSRRRGCIAAAVLFGIAYPLPAPIGPTLWIIGVFLVVTTTVGVNFRSRLQLYPVDRGHFSERLGLFVLILIGDVFVKTAVTVHEGHAKNADLLQLGFVAIVSWMVWRIYEREVESRPMPENPRRIVAWMVAHYLFAPFLLISGIGLVWYVAPDYQKIYGDWIAFVAIGGIAGAIASIAIMRRAAAGTDAKQATARLLVIAAGAVVIGLLAWLATPSDWRVGVGSLAVFLLLANSAVERSERTGADPAG